MRRKSDNPWTVTNNDICPAGLPDACCYCKVKLGQQHKPTCVCRERTVVVDVTFQLVRRVPEYWSPDQVKYGMNNARWCANNVLDELDKLAAHAASGCLCNFFTGHYIREATVEDEETFGVEIEQRRKRELDADQD